MNHFRSLGSKQRRSLQAKQRYNAIEQACIQLGCCIRLGLELADFAPNVLQCRFPSASFAVSKIMKINPDVAQEDVTKMIAQLPEDLFDEVDIPIEPTGYENIILDAKICEASVVWDQDPYCSFAELLNTDEPTLQRAAIIDGERFESVAVTQHQVQNHYRDMTSVIDDMKSTFVSVTYDEVLAVKAKLEDETDAFLPSSTNVEVISTERGTLYITPTGGFAVKGRSVNLLDLPAEVAAKTAYNRIMKMSRLEQLLILRDLDAGTYLGSSLISNKLKLMLVSGLRRVYGNCRKYLQSPVFTSSTHGLQQLSSNHIANLCCAGLILKVVRTAASDNMDPDLIYRILQPTLMDTMRLILVSE